ncbi:hypothetical protein F1559_000619 [Cyanidiococcus yangmingshanensis]|uniref:Uncharacterized protein n=1 Tax=Cyanidiococcus yangmingshanensis TaxID=2690220 RepID=A0A7J7IC27_9RHOD|nr:hypothetical protein F1559_000619 [Cyanidiococcus yangmingshanensis]
MFVLSNALVRGTQLFDSNVTRRRKPAGLKLNCQDASSSTKSRWSRCLATTIRAGVGVLSALYSLNLSSGLSMGSSLVPPVHALNGLVDLPLTHPLQNTYFLVRAGESIADARGTVESNPVDKTSVAKSGLTARGAKEARMAAEQLLQQLGFCQQRTQCWIWPSMTLNAVRDCLREVIPRLHAQDRVNAQRRPPPGEDGTPPESIFDVFIRVRQLLSKLETQYGAQGADVVIVAPDTYTLSILECMLNGEPLEQFDQHLFAPGEVHRIANPKVFPIRDEDQPHEKVNWANIQGVRNANASGG